MVIRFRGPFTLSSANWAVCRLRRSLFWTGEEIVLREEKALKVAGIPRVRRRCERNKLIAGIVFFAFLRPLLRLSHQDDFQTSLQLK